MSTDVIEVGRFHDIPVRISQMDGKRIIPLVDIATGLGIPRDTLQQLVRRNQRQFEEFSCAVRMTASDGKPHETQCLTRDGVIGLLMKLNTNYMDDPEKEEKIIEFQKWTMRTLGAVMDGRVDEIVTFNKYMSMARIFSENTHVNLGIASALALSEFGKETGTDISKWMRLLPAANELDMGNLVPTQIGKKIGIKAHEVNLLLTQLEFQVSRDGVWRLTELGAEYGSLYPYNNAETGHSGFYIRWKDSVIPKVIEMKAQSDSNLTP